MSVAANQSSAGTDLTGKQRDGFDLAPACYFPRHLRIIDDQGQTRTVDEAELLARAGPKVVLGEPGMGKSELIVELGRKLSVQPITAVRFMLSKSPGGFVVAGKPLLIDGLDEAMARREGDAVDLILAQLDEAGSPDFILSCRAREWQTRSVTNLRRIYGTDPAIFTLEPLSREEASAFLRQRYAKVDSEYVLNHLDGHGIAELYSNPLTLGMMGQVAEHDAQLPVTRAALFERVCTLIWPEHDLDRQDSSLAKITQDQALLAAGAIMAGLLLAGADAASLSGPGQVADGDIRFAELATLPGADAAQAIFTSKLFHSAGIGRAQPIHRVIAEFLGARWLAQQVKTTRARRRLLAQLHGTGAVPASLRGLHAWLAFHSPPMAKAVIAADPFGVLRYGETASLTTDQADCMFDALHALSEVDPYFRAQDWNSHTAAGLMISNLRTKIEATIASAGSNHHLRCLLIEGLRDTPLAGELANTLETVMLSTERFYREREDAAEALRPHRDRAWWQQAIAILRDQGSEDSTRLARNMIEEIDCDVPDDLLVATLFAEMGVSICPLPQIKKRQVHTLRHYGRTVDALPTARLINVLNLLIDHAPLLEHGDWESQNDLAKIVSSLIVRAMDEKAVHVGDAAMLWNWLGTFQHAHHFNREEKEPLQARLDVHEDLRRAIQQHALYEARARPTIWLSDIDLGRRSVGLTGRPADITWFLERISGADNKNAALRADWCDFMRLGISGNGFDAGLRAASRKFQNSDAQLEAFVRKLENPNKSAWERKQQRDEAKGEKKRRISHEMRRRHYRANRTALCAGEFREILEPSKVYLGLFMDQDRKKLPMDRLAEWLDSELMADTMAGLEAVLHRKDLPSSTEVARGFAEGRTWNYCFAIMAGMLARQCAGQSFADLAADVRTTALLLCHSNFLVGDHDDLPALRDALEQSIVPTAKDRESFACLWIEPSLAAGTSHISALYKLAHDKRWQAIGVALAPKWLMTFSHLPKNIELELVDCLTHSGAVTALASVAAARADTVFQDDEHMYAWLAIDALVRFDTVLPDLSGIGAQHPEFIWFLRDRFQLERRGAILPVSVAQASWIVSEFRTHWPYADLEGSGTGNTNPYDATDFLRAMINRIADDTNVEAREAMQALISELTDSYTNMIRHMAVEQRQKRAEEDFTPLLPKDLGELLNEGPPSNADDLKSLVLEELTVAQRILLGDDVDQVRDFWSDEGRPYDENRCRDRLTAMIGPELIRYNIQRITEADMPKTKRADLAFACGQLQIPMEVKGQWHPEVWQAATDQLDLKYLIDWRSEQRGIYCVLWFGNLPSTSGRRLQAPPKGHKAPDSANEMRNMLNERIPEARRALIDVVVLDLTAGKP
jgi:hypothetical protein